MVDVPEDGDDRGPRTHVLRVELAGFEFGQQLLLQRGLLGHGQLHPILQGDGLGGIVVEAGVDVDAGYALEEQLADDVAGLDPEDRRQRFDGDRLFDLDRLAALHAGLGLDVRAAPLADVQVDLEAAAVLGRIAQADLAFGEVGLGKLAEFFVGLPAAAFIGAAASAAACVGFALGRASLACFFVAFFSDFHAAPGGRTGRGVTRAAFLAGGAGTPRGARGLDHVGLFHADNARSLDRGRLEHGGVQLGSDRDRLAFDGDRPAARRPQSDRRPRRAVAVRSGRAAMRGRRTGGGNRRPVGDRRGRCFGRTSGLKLRWRRLGPKGRRFWPGRDFPRRWSFRPQRMRDMRHHRRRLLRRLDSNAGPSDTGPLDADPLGAGPFDTGPLDAGPPDAGPPDAGAPDAGASDAGAVVRRFSHPRLRRRDRRRGACRLDRFRHPRR